MIGVQMGPSGRKCVAIVARRSGDRPRPILHVIHRMKKVHRGRPPRPTASRQPVAQDPAFLGHAAVPVGCA